MLKIIISLYIVTLVGVANDNINFTKEELDFIKKTPVVKIASGETFEPFIFENSNGEISGFDRDFADIIEQKSGLKIEFEVGNWPKMQERAKAGEFDGLSSVIITDERKKIYNFSDSYLSYTAIAIVNRSNPKNIYKKADVQHKKVAVQKGNAGFEKMAKDLGDVQIVYYDTTYDVLNAVVTNEVDFTILDESVYYIANKLGISGFITTSFVVGQNTKLFFALTKEKAPLVSIFNKVIASISDYQRSEIEKHWFKRVDTSVITFSPEEIDYVYSKKSLSICVNPEWYPFEKTEKGEYVGMGADYFKHFTDKIKVPVELVKTKSWSESLAFVKERRCDILPMAMKTKQREGYLNFTSPYVNVPLVIATKEDVPFLQSMDTLKGEKIGIVEGHAFSEILRQKYPEFIIIHVKDTKEGLERVENGELFGFIDALASISYQFQVSLEKELKISGRFDEQWELSVGIRNDDPVLLGIFEKVVTSLDSKKRQEILNKYISIKYESSVDYTMLYIILFIFLCTFGVTLLWNKRIKDDKERLNKLYEELKIKDKKLQEANKELEKISFTDKLTNIYNRRKIDEALMQEIERSSRSNEKFSLIMIDIDHFKNINDTYGHQIGDKVLFNIAQLIRENIRKIDIVGRWGGEEFIIISPHMEEEGGVVNAERLRHIIEVHNFDDVKTLTASFGVTIYQENDDYNSLLKRADTALYKAKSKGRNRVVLNKI